MLDAIEIDDDLLANSARSLETLVSIGWDEIRRVHETNQDWFAKLRKMCTLKD